MERGSRPQVYQLLLLSQVVEIKYGCFTFTLTFISKVEKNHGRVSLLQSCTFSLLPRWHQSPPQPFLVSSHNAPAHKRLLTFKQHSFPFVVFAPIRSLTLLSMKPIKSQNIVNKVIFPALSAMFSNSQVLEGCYTDTAGNNHIHKQRNLHACIQFFQIQALWRKPKKLNLYLTVMNRGQRKLKHFTTASEIKSYQKHVHKHKPQEMSTWYACTLYSNKPAS